MYKKKDIRYASQFKGYNQQFLILHSFLSKEMARRRSYKQELNEKKIKLQHAIIKAEKKIYNKQMDKKWFEDYSQLNSLKLDLMIVKSRLENFRKKYKGLNIVNVNINIHNEIDLI